MFESVNTLPCKGRGRRMQLLFAQKGAQNSGTRVDEILLLGLHNTERNLKKQYKDFQALHINLRIPLPQAFGGRVIFKKITCLQRDDHSELSFPEHKPAVSCLAKHLDIFVVFASCSDAPMECQPERCQSEMDLELLGNSAMSKATTCTSKNQISSIL